MIFHQCNTDICQKIFRFIFFLTWSASSCFTPPRRRRSGPCCHKCFQPMPVKCTSRPHPTPPPHPHPAPPSSVCIKAELDQTVLYDDLINEDRRKCGRAILQSSWCCHWGHCLFCSSPAFPTNSIVVFCHLFSDLQKQKRERFLLNLFSARLGSFVPDCVFQICTCIVWI